MKVERCSVCKRWIKPERIAYLNRKLYCQKCFKKKKAWRFNRFRPTDENGNPLKARTDASISKADK